MAAAGSVVVLANPTAGEGKAGRLIGRVNAILDEIGIDHEIRVSGSAQEMESLARSAGAHLYNEDGDVLYATPNLLSVHTVSGGPRTFKL